MPENPYEPSWGPPQDGGSHGAAPTGPPPPPTGPPAYPAPAAPPPVAPPPYLPPTAPPAYPAPTPATPPAGGPRAPWETPTPHSPAGYGQQPYGQQSYGPPGFGPPGSIPPGGAQSPFAVPPSGQPSKAKKFVAAFVALALIAGVAVLAVAFGDGKGPTAGGIVRVGADVSKSEPGESLRDDADTDGVELIGANGGEVDRIAAAAIADLEQYWSEQMPELFDKPYDPVTGGFYSWSDGEDLPACAVSPEEIRGNAFYCGAADEIGWDDTSLMPDLLHYYGDLAVAVVFAHEWGHVVQARVAMSGRTVTLEQQADCYAGAWVANARAGRSAYFSPSDSDMDQALAGYLELGDARGSTPDDETAHGSAFDRINSFQEGLEDGPESCTRYNDRNVADRLVQIGFYDPEDYRNDGDAPYEDILSMIDEDLNDFWGTVGPEVGSGSWTPMAAGTPFSPNSGEVGSCGGDEVADTSLFYCPDDRSVHFDNDELFPEVYESFGDFGLAQLYAMHFTYGALDTYSEMPDSDEGAQRAAHCLTGAWAASIFRHDRSTSNMRLSSGDFDEAVQVLLAMSAGDSAGSGFQRVSAFRLGVTDGATACLS